MEYLTANEIAKKWNVTSRMVAYYCKAEKIRGASKLGKTWMIPAHAEKPSDHRYRKNRMLVQDNPELPCLYICCETEERNMEGKQRFSEKL